MTEQFWLLWDHAVQILTGGALPAVKTLQRVARLRRVLSRGAVFSLHLCVLSLPGKTKITHLNRGAGTFLTTTFIFFEMVGNVMIC